MYVMQKIAKRLVSERAMVIAYYPVALENAKKVLGDEISYAKTVEEALWKAELTFILMEWDEIKKSFTEDFSKIKEQSCYFRWEKLLSIGIF